MSPFILGSVYVPLSVVGAGACLGSGVFLRRRTKPIIQKIRHAEIPAAMQPRAANKLAGNSNNFLVAPHSLDDSS